MSPAEEGPLVSGSFNGRFVTQSARVVRSALVVSRGLGHPLHATGVTHAAVLASLELVRRCGRLCRLNRRVSGVTPQASGVLAALMAGRNRRDVLHGSRVAHETLPPAFELVNYHGRLGRGLLLGRRRGSTRSEENHRSRKKTKSSDLHVSRLPHSLWSIRAARPVADPKPGAIVYPDDNCSIHRGGSAHSRQVMGHSVKLPGSGAISQRLSTHGITARTSGAA